MSTINKSAHTKKSGNLFNDPRMSISKDDILEMASNRARNQL